MYPNPLFQSGKIFSLKILPWLRQEYEDRIPKKKYKYQNYTTSLTHVLVVLPVVRARIRRILKFLGLLILIELFFNGFQD